MCVGQVTMKSDQVKLLFDRWQPFHQFSGEFVTCFLVLVLVQKWSWLELFQSLTPGFGSGTEMCHVFHPNASNSNYNEISPHCNGSNSNFPQFQGNSPSVTKGTSGVAVVGTRGELNRCSANIFRDANASEMPLKHPLSSWLAETNVLSYQVGSRGDW